MKTQPARIMLIPTMSKPVVPIAERIARLQADIAMAAKQSNRSPDDVTLLAVSKKQPQQRLQEAYDAGLRDFGENYLQGLDEHAAQLGKDLRWHFIGHIQSKKAKHLAWVHLIHSVDSLKVAELLAAAGREQGRAVRCLLNVNISGEDSKSGLAANELTQLLHQIEPLEGIAVDGLMCIPSPEEEPRRAFARLRELRDATDTDFDLKELSMGMSDSFREAIAEGATIVRVGTALFGERD